MATFRRYSYAGMFLLFHLISLGNGIKVDSGGGYEVVVALDENTPLPNVGVERYIENMKVSLSVFSSRMWQATKSQFHLKSVDLLLPSNWTTTSASSATTQNFQSADIRLSPNVYYPHAENPNVCGQPGNFIELPVSFFNVTNSGPYGLHWKSLLHTWALYRWGVHPEHGYVGDTRFPYAHRDLRAKEWVVTGCSDEIVSGQFKDIANPENSCESNSNMSNTCRFVPQIQGQNATTSLMHFHWIDSVTDFCDEHNHNKFSPNKQNALCDHKSVWEVIRGTPDYLAVTTPSNTSIPAMTFKVVKHSATPVFYLLMDRGLVQGSISIANKVPRLIANFFSNIGLRSTVASIGVYPGTGNNVLTTLLGWSEIGLNLDKFHKAIDEIRIDGPLERDFSRALVAVADKIKQKNHPNGAVVLLVKNGANVKSFSGYLPESEVLNAFNEHNIIFNTIELNFPNHTGYSHLAGISQGTGGSYTVLDNFGEVETNVGNVLGYVRRTLVTEYTELKKIWKTIRKDAFSTATSISIPAGIKGSLQIFVSSMNSDLNRTNFAVTGYNVTGAVVPRPLSFSFSKTRDWNEEASKLTYRLEVPLSQLVGLTQLSLQVSCTSGNCATNILSRAEFTEESNQINIEVHTSLETSHADLSTGQPISLYTKITKRGIAVRDAIVIATVTEAFSSRTTSIRLLDDGEGAPDAQELDGVYSAYFAPENDGQYKISVTVEGRPTRNSATNVSDAKTTTDESALIRLLPVDQGDIGCGSGNCDAEVIEGSFSQAVELATPISVVQTSLYIPSPTKIFFMTAVDRPDLGQGVLSWISPYVPGRLQQAVTTYEVRSAQSRELLISNFSNQTLVPLPPNFIPKTPGRLETVSISRPPKTLYYALRSVYRGKLSPLSSVVELFILDDESTTTETTPTGSTTTPTGPTTTPTGPTTPPVSGSTTPPTSDSTTGPTTTPTGPTTPPVSGSTTPPTSDSTTTPGPSKATGLTRTHGLIFSCFIVLIRLL